MSAEIIVKCPECDDMFHTFCGIGDSEVCIEQHVFQIEEGDVVTEEEYAENSKAALEPEAIAFDEAQQNAYEEEAL